VPAWFHETRAARWANSAAVKQRYPTASIVNAERVVFDICGGRYRLVVRINYRTFTIHGYTNGDHLPAAVEDLFRAELEESRRPLPADRPDRDAWRFACLCALSPDGELLGGVHLDIGPLNSGPLAADKLAYVEALCVLPPYRRQGLGTALLREACAVARRAGCLYLRCHVRWDNPAALALYRRCGCALVDIGDEEEYFVVRSLAAAD
jgi:ribosomal protein S18 acetylase RimI-like enzyme